LDGDDNCPKNKDINETSFSNYVTLDFDPSLTSEASPFWQIKDSGKDIKQFTTTLKPVALIGKLKIISLVDCYTNYWIIIIYNY